MSRPNRAIRLLVQSLLATGVSALLGMYLVLQAVVIHAGEDKPLTIVAASFVDLALMGLAVYVLNKASQSPADGGPFLPRGRKLMRIWAICTVLVVVFVVVSEVIGARSAG